MSRSSSKAEYSAFPGLGRSRSRRASQGSATGRQTGCGPGTVLGFHQARGALWHALRAHGIGPETRVLMPAYHCGVEVEAALDLGAQVDYYRVTPAFQSDPSDIRRRAAPNTRAILVIHYFGFPQPIDPIVQICRENRWVLIEDCAHTLCDYPGAGRVGRAGNVALYSLPKTLPVPDGGLLRVNHGPTPTEPSVLPRALPVARQIVRLAISGLKGSDEPMRRWAGNALASGVRLASAAARKSSVSSELAEWNPAGGGFHREMAQLGLSRFSKRFLDREDLSAVAEARRRNCARLLERLKGMTEPSICVAGLPDDACPMVLPVRTHERDRLASNLLDRGVGSFVFGKNLHPTMSRADFPEAGALSDTILGLPVHQDLDDRAIDAIGDALVRSGEGR